MCQQNSTICLLRTRRGTCCKTLQQGQNRHSFFTFQMVSTCLYTWHSCTSNMKTTLTVKNHPSMSVYMRLPYKQCCCHSLLTLFGVAWVCREIFWRWSMLKELHHRNHWRTCSQSPRCWMADGDLQKHLGQRSEEMDGSKQGASKWNTKLCLPVLGWFTNETNF